MKKLFFSILILTVSCLAVSVPAATTLSSSDADQAQQQEFLRAVGKGDVQRVTEMLRTAPSLVSVADARGNTAVMLALYTGHRDVAQVIASQRRQFNLFEAAALGNAEQVEKLLKASPQKINDYSLDGFTALHLAAYFGQTATLRELVAAGADLNLYSHNGLHASPLQSAAAARQLESVRILLEAGADVNCHGELDYTPLHEAAGSGQVQLIALLLAHGADANAKGTDGKTPLSIAIEEKQPAAADLLRQKGAQ
ncbi:MAG TPA: ankyrin repeat domain-containing protein [Alphaproteobacteria bacterium]|nr:ankyrin repeat domain-containing protein [Alphaproteobacteria bacterium]